MPRGPRPAPLPGEFDHLPFRVASALDAGTSDKRLRASDLDHSVRGVRAPMGTATSLHGRAAMFAARLPVEAFFSHETAAMLWKAPLPPRFEETGRLLHVTVPAGRRAPHADGLAGHSRVVADGDVVELHGIRISSPERMWCEFSRAVDVSDLVAVGDFLVHWRQPLTSITSLTERVLASGRLGHRTRLLTALPLLSERSESRPESLLRVILIRAGLPLPAINHPIVDTESGAAFRSDFAYPELRIALEYQGDYHRSKAQWRADMIRRRRLESQGWIVIEVNGDDLRHPAELIAQLRGALERRTRLFA